MPILAGIVFLYPRDYFGEQFDQYFIRNRSLDFYVQEFSKIKRDLKSTEYDFENHEKRLQIIEEYVAHRESYSDYSKVTETDAQLLGSLSEYMIYRIENRLGETSQISGLFYSEKLPLVFYSLEESQLKPVYLQFIALERESCVLYCPAVIECIQIFEDRFIDNN